METKKESKFSNIFNMSRIGMAVIAYMIGSGYASGQEIMQFFVSYGRNWWIPMILCFIMIFWTCMSFARAGSVNDFEKNEDLYYYYCGKYLGKFMDWFSMLIVFCLPVYMLSAAGSSFHETFGTPVAVGAIILGAAVVLTLTTGFNGLSNVLAASGVFNIAMIIIVSIYTIVMNYQGIPEGVALVEAGNSGVAQAGHSPVLSGLAYHGVSIMYIGVFISQTARRNNKFSTSGGAFIGSVGYTLLATMSVFTMFSVLAEVAKVDIPNLTLAYRITPFAGTIFTFIIILEIYNSATALFWTVTSRLAPEEKSRKFLLTSIVLVTIAIIISVLVPYRTLMGYIMTFGGYIANIFFAAIIIKDVRVWMSNRSSKLQISN